MSVSTFSELKTAIATWAHRTDLTSVIPDFITMCEADMANRLKLVELETNGTVTMTAGSGTVPTGLLNIRSISMDGEGQLRYLSPSRFNDFLEDNESGDGIYYTIIGTTIKTAPPTTGTLDVVYSTKITSLSDGAPTNVILTNYPDAYLYGSLFHADVYVKKDASANKALYEQAIQRIKDTDMNRKYAGELTVKCA